MEMRNMQINDQFDKYLKNYATSYFKSIVKHYVELDVERRVKDQC